MRLNKNLKLLLFILFIFLFNIRSVFALTNESTAKCNYKIGGGTFTLTYKNGNLSYNKSPGGAVASYVKYKSEVLASNLITNDEKLKCPSTLYWNSSYDGGRVTTYTIYPTNDKAKNSVSLDSEEINNPIENTTTDPSGSETNNDKLIICYYDNIAIMTDGVKEIFATSSKNADIEVKFSAKDFGTSCKEGIYYTCNSYTYSNVTYSNCMVSLTEKKDGIYFNKYAELKDDVLNADDLDQTNGIESLIAINKMYDQLDKVKNDPTDENKNIFYNYVKNARNFCQKIYADTTKNEGDQEYDECIKLDNELTDWVDSGYFGNRLITNNIGTDCDAVLGSLGVWLTRIYKILLVAVPVIIVAFGFKDFIKSLTSGKEDELKKAGSTFIKRLVFGAVFVALPIIVKVILTLALGGDLANICIL